MPVLLFKLNHVPEDEANDVRELLSDNGVEFYETSAGKWGFSLAAIWLKDEQLLERARVLIDDYQRQRVTRVHEELRQEEVEGRRLGLVEQILAEPLRYILVLAFLLFILYVSIVPFLDLGR